MAPMPSILRLLLGTDPTIAGFRTGRWRWPWAMLATAATIGFFAVFTLLDMELLKVILAPDGGWMEVEGTALLRPGHLFDYAAIVAIWLAMPIGGLLALRLVKGDPVHLALTQTGRFHADDFIKSAAALLVVYGLSTVIGYALDPASYQMPDRAPGFLAWLALGVAVILVQSASEEIFFRGVLFRIWGAVVPARLIIAVIMGVFIAMHIPNADVQIDVGTAVAVFVISEIIAYWILLRTKCLAAPMGLHWMNNVFAFFLVASLPAGDTDAALFVYTDPIYAAGGSRFLDPWTHALTAIATALLLVLLFWQRSPLHLPRRAVMAAAAPARDAVTPSTPGASEETRDHAS